MPLWDWGLPDEVKTKITIYHRKSAKSVSTTNLSWKTSLLS